MKPKANQNITLTKIIIIEINKFKIVLFFL